MDIEQLVLAQHKLSYLNQKVNLTVGYGTDQNYIRCVASSIASICINNRDVGLRFYIITDYLEEASIQKLHQMAKWYQIDIWIYVVADKEILKTLPIKSHFPLSIYFRYFLPLIIKSGKVLYLDADVVNLKPLNKLIDIDLEEYVVAAVQDLEWMERKRCKALGMEFNKYFNSGVLLIDIDKWNLCKIFERSIELLKCNPNKYTYPDQDVLNILLQEKVKYLGREYNCLDSNLLDNQNIVLLHFAAHPKPWNIAWSLCNSRNEFNSNIYNEYESKTPWRDEPLYLPRNNKECKIYAQCLFKTHQYVDSFRWFIKYIKGKIK